MIRFSRYLFWFAPLPGFGRGHFILMKSKSFIFTFFGFLKEIKIDEVTLVKHYKKLI